MLRTDVLRGMLGAEWMRRRRTADTKEPLAGMHGMHGAHTCVPRSSLSAKHHAGGNKGNMSQTCLSVLAGLKLTIWRRRNSLLHSLLLGQSKQQEIKTNNHAKDCSELVKTSRSKVFLPFGGREKAFVVLRSLLLGLSSSLLPSHKQVKKASPGSTLPTVFCNYCSLRLECACIGELLGCSLDLGMSFFQGCGTPRASRPF